MRAVVPEKGRGGEREEAATSVSALFIPDFALSDNPNGHLVVLVNDNKDDIEDEPEVHLLDADVVAEEVKLHHGHHEPSDITSEENIRSQPLNTCILRSCE